MINMNSSSTVTLDPDKVKDLLIRWKKQVESKVTSDDGHYDFGSNSSWLKHIEFAKNTVDKLQKPRNDRETIETLRDLLTKKTFWASNVRLMGTLLNLPVQEIAGELLELKEIFLDMKNFSLFRKEWADRIYKLLENNNKTRAGIRNFRAGREFLMNRLSEIHGFLHPEDSPIYNGCSKDMLGKILGLKVGFKNYQEFRANFEKFKEAYVNIIGKLSNRDFPINIEIDQMLNYYQKSDYGKNIMRKWLDGKLTPIIEDKYSFWKFSPGRRAVYWGEFKSRKIISMGSWLPEVGDLRNYKTSEELRNRIPDLSYPARKQMFDFKDGVKIGDVIVSYGRKAILDFGIVKSDYGYDEKTDVDWWRAPKGMHHWRSVNWLNKYPSPLRIDNDDSLYKELSTNDTIHEITDPEIVNNLKKMVGQLEERHLSDGQRIENPLNIILYGPPGTGKTYATKAVVASIEKGISARDTLCMKDLSDFINETKSEYENIRNEKRIEFITFHPSYSYEDFVEGIRARTKGNRIEYYVRDGTFKKLCLEAEKELKNNQQNPRKFYLIIDEINRGNISKIFGESITLVEEDKRLGKENELITKLPYSDESSKEFSVPKNLYIIGTMNTADRSIALVDIALRRRFEFFELMPKPELLKDKEIEGVNLTLLLSKLNERIIKRGERDKQIGHAYFMIAGKPIDNKNDLRIIWFHKIMPLLNEYFYGRWEDFAFVLSGKDTPASEMPFLREINPDEGIFDFIKEQEITNFMEEIARILKE